MASTASTNAPAPHFSDWMIERSDAIDSRVVVGLDPDFTKFPAALQQRVKGGDDAAVTDALVEFNKAMIDGTAEYAVAFKPQAAFYEQYGLAGYTALLKTIACAREAGVPVILDGKRNDIGHTAGAYGQAWLADELPFIGKANTARADAVTVNGYLGSDGIHPFLVAKEGAGLFVLGKTSNPSSGELQDHHLKDSGLTVYETMASLCHGWGESNIGASGFSRVGLVVGATYPELAARIRNIAPNSLFLMPGVGAQGAGVEGIVLASRSDGHGAYASSSRGIMYSFDKAAGADDSNWHDAVESAAAREAGNLRDAIRTALTNR